MCERYLIAEAAELVEAAAPWLRSYTDNPFNSRLSRIFRTDSGLVPLGYEVRDRQLVIEPSEAETVRNIFQLYCELGSVRLLKNELDQRGIRSKLRVAENGARSGGKSFSRGALYTLLGNPIYIGEVRNKGTRHPGQHQPIVERAVWEKTDELLRAHAARARGKISKSMSSPLAGKLFEESGEKLTPSHAVKGKRRYRYYVSRSLITGTANQSEAGWRILAPEIERSVAAAARTRIVKKFKRRKINSRS